MSAVEEIQCCGITLQLPADLCTDFTLLTDVISPETWNNFLTDDNREELMNFLPAFPENDVEEKTRTLEMFFMDVNFLFSTPLRQFHQKLKSGYFNPAVIKQRSKKEAAERKIYRYQYRDYLHHTLEETIICRQQYLELARSLPPDSVPPPLAHLSIPLILPTLSNVRRPHHPHVPHHPRSSKASLEHRSKRRYFRELVAAWAEAGLTGDLSDDDNYPEGPDSLLHKKQRRLLHSAESCLPPALLPVRRLHSTGTLARDLELQLSPQGTTLDPTDEDLLVLMEEYEHQQREARKAGRYVLSGDTRGTRLGDVIRRAAHNSKRHLDARHSGVKQRGRREGAGGGSSAGHATLASTQVEVEGLDEDEDEEHEEMYHEDVSLEEGVKDELPSLSHYVTLASGEVRNASPRTADAADKKRSSRPTHQPTAKRRLLVSSKMRDSGGEEEAGSTPTKWDAEASLETTAGSVPPAVNTPCFFSLLRCLFCAPPLQRLTRADIECGVRAWQQSAAARACPWYGDVPHWGAALPATLNFLAGHAGDAATPPDFVPYMQYKPAARAYQWIGAGRDGDDKLQPLYLHWLANRSLVNSAWLVSSSSHGTVDATVGEDGELVEEEEDAGGEECVPAPRCPTSWTVQPATAEERASYRQQERVRYEKPHRAFTYRMHGYESVVGPVKGIYSQHSGPNKARGHSLLTPNRPAYVTILALVRDAVARLPNGEGTRADICELLRESQYLAPLHSATAESALHSVVSGALDRLHYEQDPCVKYLTARKMWVYLHRNRDEQEFERMHHLNGPGSTKNKKPAARRHPRAKPPTKEALKPPPNVAIDPQNVSVKVEGGQVKMLPEDVLVKTDTSLKVLGAAVKPTVASPVPGSPLPTSPAVVVPVSASVAAKTCITAVSYVTSMSCVTAPSSGITTVTASTAVANRGIPVTSPTKTLTAVKMAGNSVRSLLASSLQTIQVSTAAGIQTIRVALPAASAAHHLAKGTLVGRLSGAGAGVLALNSRPGKQTQQPLGQIIQTSSGAQFITTGLGGSGSLGGQAVSGVTRGVLTSQQRMPQPLVLSSAAVASLPTATVSSAIAVSRPMSVVSCQAVAVTAATSLTSSASPQHKPQNCRVSGGMKQHVVSVAVVSSSGSNTTGRVTGITAQQLTGLKLIPAPLAAHHLQQGGGQRVLGQKLVVSGNKVLLQGGKVMQGGVQQLVTVQQQLSPSSGAERLTLVTCQTTPSLLSSVITTTANQRLLLHPGIATSGKSGSSVLSVAGQQLALSGGVGKGRPQATVQRPLLLQGDKLGQVVLGGDKVSGQVVASIAGQQLVLASAGGRQQQLVLPAGALQGGHYSLNGLQAFHTLKVIPSGGGVTGTGGGSGKAVVAHLVQQPTVRVCTNTSTTTHHPAPSLPTTDSSIPPHTSHL